MVPPQSRGGDTGPASPQAQGSQPRLSEQRLGRPHPALGRHRTGTRERGLPWSTASAVCSAPPRGTGSTAASHLERGSARPDSACLPATGGPIETVTPGPPPQCGRMVGRSRRPRPRGRARMNGTSPPPLADLLLASCRALAVDGAGVSVLSATSLDPLYATNEVATEIERLQFMLGEGPCVHSVATRTPVLVADLAEPQDAASSAWPVFRTEARKLGARAIFAFPLSVGENRLGTVDFYRASPGALRRPDLAAARLAVEEMGLALLERPNPYVGYDAENASTSIIHQAAGRAKVQLDCTIEVAMVRLRAQAFAEGKPLSEFAADIVHGRRSMTKEQR